MNSRTFKNIVQLKSDHTVTEEQINTIINCLKLCILSLPIDDAKKIKIQLNFLTDDVLAPLFDPQGRLTVLRSLLEFCHYISKCYTNYTESCITNLISSKIENLKATYTIIELLDLPQNLQTEILSYLSPNDLQLTSKVCKSWRATSSEILEKRQSIISKVPHIHSKVRIFIIPALYELVKKTIKDYVNIINHHTKLIESQQHREVLLSLRQSIEQILCTNNALGKSSHTTKIGPGVRVNDPDSKCYQQYEDLLKNLESLLHDTLKTCRSNSLPENIRNEFQEILNKFNTSMDDLQKYYSQETSLQTQSETHCSL